MTATRAKPPHHRTRKSPRVSMSNIFAGLGLFFLGTCAYTSTINAREFVAVTISADPRPMGRDPKTVRFWCNRSQIAVVHGVSTVGTEHAKVPLNAACRQIEFSVETYGGDVWASGLIYVEPGDRMDIRFRSDLEATYFMVYH